MKSIGFSLRATDHIRAFAAVIPLLLAVVGLQYPPPLLDLFVHGGVRVLLYNICVIVLIPYFVIFVAAIGELYLSRLTSSDIFPLKISDIRLISFFAGAGILTILGFTLGLLNLLYFWVCFPIFICVIYIYFLQPGPKQLATELWSWIKADKYAGSIKVALIILRAALIAMIAAILLSKGILLELFKDGGLHQYFSYFADTILYHSTWMDPTHPVLYDYLSGRGQGAYLFLTSFTNQFTIQILGSIYLIAIGAVSRQVISFLLSATQKTQEEASFQIFLPDLVMLLVISSPLLDMEPARFHLQTGAFFLFLAWTTPLFLFFDRARGRWLFLSQIPIIFAFPITEGIFLGFVGFIFCLEIISLILTRNKTLLRYSILSIVIAAVSGILSFSLNWLYVGIPDIQPAQIFIPFIAQNRFQQWSSVDLLLYLNSSLNSAVATSFYSISKTLTDGLALLSYPVILFLKQNSGNLDLAFPILVLALLLIIAVRSYRSHITGQITGLPPKEILAYVLTFASFYILKLVLTEFIQQSSLNRMLLFMDAFPIIIFFAIIIFLSISIDPITERSTNVTPEKVLVPTKPLLTAPVLPKHTLTILASLGLGMCIAIIVINHWAGFWQRSIQVQISSLALLSLSGSVLVFISIKKIIPLFPKLTIGKRLTLINISSFITLVLTFVLSRYITMPPYPIVQHRLALIATNDKNPASLAVDVKLLKLKIGEEIITPAQVARSGSWTDESDVIQSSGQSVLTYYFTDRQDVVVHLLFLVGPSSGIAKIEYDDRIPISKDLYSAEDSAQAVSLVSNLLTWDRVLLVTMLYVAEFIAIVWLLLLLLLLISFNGLEKFLYTPLILLAIILGFYQFKINFGFDKISGGWRYLIGDQGAIGAYGPVVTYEKGSGDRSDVLYCLEILAKVPGPAHVLDLNGFGAVEPCLFSPLLPRDKIVHHYESVAITGPYYRTLMFGDPEAAYAIYRKLGINYFYIRKNDVLFVNLGYSHALEPQYLEQYFDLYAESSDFYILTWRGQGLYPVSHELEQEISTWYVQSKDPGFNPLNFWWKGVGSLENWEVSQGLK